MEWPLASPDRLFCPNRQAPPLRCFFNLAQVTYLLLAPLFSFDSFSIYPTKSDSGYMEKLSFFFTSFLPFSKLGAAKREKDEKLTETSNFGKTWHFSRGPPRKSEPEFNHILIFGGQVMKKFHAIQRNILITTHIVVVTLYHCSQSVTERG